MEEFLAQIVASIVEDPSTVRIEKEEADNLDIYTIFVPGEEIGKVIGKEGKVINAIRCLARLKAMKTQQRILVKVGDQGENGSSRPTMIDDSEEKASPEETA
jgi:predicted RNA-binding protein YlqC (UPF0109 family)